MHTVVPNLLRLGLISERTEQSWRDVGILTDSRQSPLRELPLTA